MMSSESLFKIVLTLLHSIFSVVLWFFNLYENLRTRLVFKQDVEADFQYLSDNLKQITKLPKHLLVNLGNEEPRLQDLANIIMWCAASGISYTSFYDYRGKVKDSIDEFYEEVGNRNGHDDFKIIWPQRGHDNSNGYKYKTSVNVLSLEDSHKKVADLTRELSESVKSDVISADTINKYFEACPDPELGFYCGNVCSTYGCPPWQIRVTEFLNLPSHHNLSVKQFVQCLRVYSKCEQRFGK